jgi:hypothetical protein
MSDTSVSFHKLEACTPGRGWTAAYLLAQAGPVYEHPACCHAEVLQLHMRGQRQRQRGLQLEVQAAQRGRQARQVGAAKLGEAADDRRAEQGEGFSKWK